MGKLTCLARTFKWHWDTVSPCGGVMISPPRPLLHIIIIALWPGAGLSCHHSLSWPGAGFSCYPLTHSVDRALGCHAIRSLTQLTRHWAVMLTARSLSLCLLECSRGSTFLQQGLYQNIWFRLSGVPRHHLTNELGIIRKQPNEVLINILPLSIIPQGQSGGDSLGRGRVHIGGHRRIGPVLGTRWHEVCLWERSGHRRESCPVAGRLQLRGQAFKCLMMMSFRREEGGAPADTSEDRLWAEQAIICGWIYEGVVITVRVRIGVIRSLRKRGWLPRSLSAGRSVNRGEKRYSHIMKLG